MSPYSLVLTIGNRIEIEIEFVRLLMTEIQLHPYATSSPFLNLYHKNNLTPVQEIFVYFFFCVITYVTL